MKLKNVLINGLWKNIPENKIVINKGMEEPKFTEYGLKRYAAIKGVPINNLIRDLWITVDETEDNKPVYNAKHWIIQRDAAFIFLLEHEYDATIFSNSKYYIPHIVDLTPYQDKDNDLILTCGRFVKEVLYVCEGNSLKRIE